MYEDYFNILKNNVNSNYKHDINNDGNHNQDINNIMTQINNLQRENIKMAEKLRNIEEQIIPNMLNKIHILEMDHKLMKKGSNIKKCFIFDFDCTITFNHWFHFTNSFEHWVKLTGKNMDLSMDIPKLRTIRGKINMIMQQSIEYYENDPNLIDEWIKTINLSDEHIQILKKYFIGSLEREKALIMFFQILQNNNYELYISSKGYYIYIQILLRLLGLKHFFKDENIYGRQKCSVKNNRIICEEENPKDKILVNLFKIYDIVRYVDDDAVDHQNLISKHINDIISDYKYYGFVPNSNYSLNINLIKDNNGLNVDLMNIILNDNSLAPIMSGGYYKYKKYKNKYLLSKRKY